MLQIIVALFSIIAFFAFAKIDKLAFETASISKPTKKLRKKFSVATKKLFAIADQGILGPLRGKVGGAVASSWKGINYFKGYVIPANPNTAAQQAQRGRMAAAVALAQQLSSLVVQEYFNPLAIKMSGFNKFIKNNIMNLADTTYYVTTDNVMSVGSLIGAAISNAALLAGEVTVTYDDTVQGNGLATDDVDLIVINKETNAVYVNQNTLTRADGSGVVDVGNESDETKLIAFLVCKRGTGSDYTVSNSTSFQVTT